MIGDDHADALVLELHDHALDVADRDGVDAGKGLVQEQVLGIEGHGPRNLDPPALAARERDALALAHPLEAEVRNDLVAPVLERAALEALGLERHGDVLLDRQSAEDRGLLRQIADALERPTGQIELGQILLAQIDLAGIRLDEAHHHVEGRGLAGAVGPQQANDLATTTLERQAFDDRSLTVAFLEAGGFEHHFFHSSMPDSSSVWILNFTRPRPL
ncbi:MAG: hypothetical protein BWY87_01607 [Deltaproteobacteria bacterium ADurb.Bin510]|nr:MAG: hypothetical protein BWY87_01607 [Deltaproteobacteria bacterium ADurb.Bin510]